MFNIVKFFTDDGDFYYNAIRKLNTNRHVVSSLGIHNFEQCMTLIYFARILNAIVPFFGTDIQRIDPVQYFFVGQKHLYGLSFEIPTLCVILYCFYLRYLFHHVPEKNVCWGTFYDVTVLGTDIFKQCRRSQAEIARRFAQTYEETRFKFRTNAWLLNTLLPTSIANHFFRLMAKLLLKFRYEEFNPNLVNARRLTVNPNLFFELRAKIVLLTEMFNYIAIIILVFFDITMILSFVIYMPTIWGPYPTFPYVPLILLDVTLIIHGMNQLARSAMILSFTAIISGTVNISHVARYRRMTEELMQKHIRLQKKLKKRQTIEDSRSIGILMEILTEHTRICSQILQYNRELYGHIVFSSLVLNIPINVAIVSRVVFQVDLPEVEKSLTVLFIMIQFSLLAVALIPLARYSKIVSHSRNLPMLIDMIGGKWIRVKIKFMAYYERINNRKKYGVSVGPSETLTNRMLFEIILVYLGYLLYCFGLAIQHKI